LLNPRCLPAGSLSRCIQKIVNAMNLWNLGKTITLAAIWAAFTASAESPHRITLEPLGTYAAGQFDLGAAEIVAHDPKTQQLFVVNAQAAVLDVLDIRNPAAPARVVSVDMKPYGAVANSVTTFDGIVAVAVENAVKTDPGVVVFFDNKLNFLNKVTVGALPDMIAATPDRKYVLVANEGEPNSDYSIDPEGSVSIIDVSRGIKQLKQTDVRNVNFAAFNAAPLDASIRIFGPGATVAQDIEPEYLAVSPDSATAYVTCQENNALAVIDIPTATVQRLVGLGFKDHSATAGRSEIFAFAQENLPMIDQTAAGQEIALGGFSGLFFEGIDTVTGKYKFVAHTDRGPNAEPNGIIRPFLLPNFTPEIVRFELDRVTGSLEITERIALQKSPGVPLTGLPNTALGANANFPYNDEVPVDLLGNILPLDPLGADLEGIVIDPGNASFWMVDEYRPAIYHFDPAGMLIERFVPQGTAAAAGAAPGSFGIEALPAILAQRRQNRGFEAVAWDNGRLYAFVQSPIRNPVSLGNAALTAMRNIRIVEFDPATRQTRQFVYIMDNADLGPEPNTRADKIGDAVSLGNGEFLVVERDDDSLPGDALSAIEKKVYRFNLVGATDVSALGGLIGATGKTVDQLTIAEMVANNIRPVQKVLHVDLTQAGYNRVQKVEGLAAIDPWTIAVINDNDFTVASITVHPDGTFTRNYLPERIEVGIVEVLQNGLDASDRDAKINIRPWPVKGMYLPDGIAAYSVRGETLLVLANEGDVREYSTFAEGVRVGSSGVTLDTAKFPNAAVLKNNSNLGRLNITSTLGRNPLTGFYEELYAFGTRSFSIRKASGELIYDSGDDLEWITALDFPANFNASNTNNDFDNRSDDKGPEPEGVVVGKVYGRDYAFVGLERIGGVMIYDVSDPLMPVFVDYINRRNFAAPADASGASDLGPEGLLLIEADDSPNGIPLLVVGNESSGTTTIFQINKTK
jgi:hypothetical protein